MTGTIFPEGAAEAAAEKGKTVDFYSNLTDEERAEEGLPPREAPKGDPPPEDAPEPEPADEPEPDEDDDAEDANEATEQLFDDLAAIASMRDDLTTKMGKTESQAPAKSDELLEAALEHDDPVVRGLGERIQKAEARVEELRAESRNEKINRQMVEDDAEFKAVQSAFTIGGKPMTEAHVGKVEKYLVSNPEVARLLTIEEATRRVFPDAVKVGHPSSPGRRPVNGSGNAAGGDAPTATIVDVGASGGAPAGPWKPRANETVESAVQAAGARLFGVKR